MATNDKIKPMACNKVIFSFNIKKANKIVTIGYKAVKTVTMDKFPFSYAFNRKKVPIPPVNPAKKGNKKPNLLVKLKILDIKNKAVKTETKNPPNI